jgi:glycosyltransferase involved in cell wall biosynthesis
LAIARQHAVEEARGELIGFLDDDNIPAPNWVAQAFVFGQAHPNVGAYGSRVYGEFEIAPPVDFDKIAPFLALTDRGAKAMCYEPKKKILPPGAGLVIRQQAWLDHVPKRCFLQGRISGPKLPGEDLEAVLYIQRAGWEIWYNPDMQITHQIPRHRLEKKYLMDLCRGIGLSRYHTRMLSVKTWQWPLLFPVYVMNDLRKLIIHLYRYHPGVNHDLITACELELIRGSLLSPLYTWKEYFKSYLREQNRVDLSSTTHQNVCY